MNREKSTTQGFSLVELVVAIAVFMIFAGGLVVTAVGGHLNSLENEKMIQANMHLIETWEAVKSIRDDNWFDISNGTHGLSSAGNSWDFSGSSDTYNGFTRTITVLDVDRNDNGDIVTSNGDLDSDTKLISIDITWSPIEGKQRILIYESYVNNYEDAAVWPPVPPPEP